jgi:HK97 family phage portal protein
MKFFGLHIPFTSRQAAFPRVRKTPQTLEMVGERGTWRSIFDHRPGAWQQHDALAADGEIASGVNTAIVYSCIRRIAGDIGKMGACVKRLEGGIWVTKGHQVWDRLLRRPNRFQTWGLFIKSWLYSLLTQGNAYVVKLYSGTSVTELVVIDPSLVTPHVTADTGEIFYHVGGDPLAHISEDTVFLAAADIIHHPYLPMSHPLLGTSPLARALTAAAAREGIVTNSANLTANGSVPPLVITVPEGTPSDKVREIANTWRAMPKHRAAVVDAAIKVDQLSAKYVDAQAAEIATLAGTDICAAFDVPPWKVGLAPPPAGDIEARQIAYYQDSLQWLVEDIEELLDHGLGLASDTAIEFDEENLLRLDSKTRAEVDSMLIKGIAKPDELRRKWGLPSVPGGNSVYMQQQNFSLEALHERDKAAPAPAMAGPAAPGAPKEPETEDPEETPEQAFRRTAWAGTWRRDKAYAMGCGFVTHDGALWARVQRAWRTPEEGTPDHSDLAEVGAEPGTNAGHAYWQLAIPRGKAPTGGTPCN